MQLPETPSRNTIISRSAHPGLAVVGVIVVLLLIVVGTARAGVGIDYDNLGTGTLLLLSGEESVPAPTVSSDIEMWISGLVARVQVRQEFRNDSTDWVEGVYVFPLPETAAVDHLSMRIGSREIVGEIRTRKAARRSYEKAKESGRKASLIEQERPNVFTNSVANIGPGETVVVQIEYQQRVDYDDGVFSLRFPMAITPRFMPGRTATESLPVGGSERSSGANQSDVTSPPVCHAPGCGSASLRVALDAGFPLESVSSAYHAIDQVNTGRGVAITLRAGRVRMDRDFELSWRASPGAGPGATVFTETVDGERYALVMFMPAQITQSAGVPRELILVIDRSGSMAGASIRQARAALGEALNRLTPQDRFNVIAFETEAQALFPNPQYADGLALDTAKGFVASLGAQGGTNIHRALELAFGKDADRRASADGFLRQVVFITDGSVANEEALFRLIDMRLGDSRLFTIGIGSAPNSYFMRKAAAFGRGSFTHVGDLGEVQDKMSSLLRKLENPSLTGIEIEWPAGANADANPDRIPDLYTGEPVMVTARLDAATDRVAIRGASGWQRRIDIDNRESVGIAVLYARERIGALMDERLRATDRGEIEERITQLALRHHLVSRFTSLVAVDKTPSRPAGFEAAKTAVTAPSPAAMMMPVLAAMPVGATSAPAWILLGALFIVIPLLLTHGWRE